MSVEEYLKQNKGTVVDVRTRAEFNSGHVASSVNIPLQELEENLTHLNSLKKPFILCCASGGRSGMAQQLLQQKGIECYNAGSWLSVNFIISKK